MQPGLSTHVFLPHRLHTGLLDTIRRAGATSIEIFAARHHFDYADRPAVREIAAWFRDSGITPTLHQPVSLETRWSRHAAPTLNLTDSEKSRRILAMDEVKRALESAEQIPFRSVILHLGMKGDKWTPRCLEDALTAIEHLQAFARPLGVQILIENLQNEITTPEHILDILRIGHFDDVRVSLDVGHAHLTDFKNPGAGIDAAFDLLKDRIAELHLHDNDGSRDEHLWPGTAPEGQGIDWPHLHQLTSTLPPQTRGVLEIAHQPEEPVETIQRKAAQFFSEEARRSEHLQQR